MDVTFLENYPFFTKNSLKGEIRLLEDNFWITDNPLPATVLDTLTPNQPLIITIENKTITSP